MPIPGLDPDKCRQRNRLAARRGFDAMPVTLLRQARTGALSASGVLPASEGEALEMISALAGEALTADQVHIRFLEACNTNFVADRYLFLHESTLRNCAADGARGVAFMNSHATGGMSHDAQLPFGRTFCGQYQFTQEDGMPRHRCVQGVYMLRGTRPNGDGGPSTDDLAAGIDAGTIFDVSVGLYGGTQVCDVCGEDLNGLDREGNYLCPHVPGTYYGMKESDVAAQQARGVPDGKASYSLHDARQGEVSAVYDGAVPGAGFRKGLAFSRRGLLDDAALSDARQAYRTLLGRHDFEIATCEPSPADGSFEEQVSEALAALDACIDRARDLHRQRSEDPKRRGAHTVSPARLAQLGQARASLEALEELCRAKRPRTDLTALRHRVMSTKVAVNRLIIGS